MPLKHQNRLTAVFSFSFTFEGLDFVLKFINWLLNSMEGICHEDNVARMQRGELYYAFTPELTALRKRCHHAVHRFNNAGEAPRRQLVALFRE